MTTNLKTVKPNPRRSALALVAALSIGLATPTSAAASGGPTALDLPTFRSQVLSRHNEYRAEHGDGALQEDLQLDTLAQNWADHLAVTDVMEHREPRVYGENIFWTTNPRAGRVVTGNAPTDWWYSECKGYDYTREPTDTELPAVVHFTQLAWRATTKIGVGIAHSATKTYIVANYDVGNVLGQFTRQVPLPVSGKPCRPKPTGIRS